MTDRDKDNPDKFRKDCEWFFTEFLYRVPLRSIAEALDVSPTTIMRYRDGDRMPQGSLARLLEESIAWAKLKVEESGGLDSIRKRGEGLGEETWQELKNEITRLKEQPSDSSQALSDMEEQVFESLSRFAFEEMRDHHVRRLEELLANRLKEVLAEHEAFLLPEQIEQLSAEISGGVEEFTEEAKDVIVYVLQQFASKVVRWVAKEMRDACWKGRKDSRQDFVDRIDNLIISLEEISSKRKGHEPL